MRILVTCFSDVSRRGENVSFALQLASSLQQRGHAVTVLSRSDAPNQRGIDLIRGVPTIFHGDSSAGVLRRLAHMPVLSLHQNLVHVMRYQVEEPDVLLTLCPFYVNAARCVWPRVRIIYLFAGFYQPDAGPTSIRRHHWLRFLHRHLLRRAQVLALRRSDQTLVPSPASVRPVLTACSRMEGRLDIAVPGVLDLKQHPVRRDILRARFHTPANATVLLAARQPIDADNVTFLLKVLQNAKAPNIMLWVAGSGPELEEVEFRAKKSGLLDRVRFLGAQAEMSEGCAAADVLVHAVRMEFSPQVYLQSMAYGLPVIGPADNYPRTVSPLPHLIQEGIHGFIYDLDSEISLRLVLEEIAGSPHMLRPMGLAARELAVSQHDWDAYIDTIQQYLLTGRQSAGPRTRKEGLR
ncbi:MAG: glycosyltransferase family 4 protein [Phycisphaerae bacterium]